MNNMFLFINKPNSEVTCCHVGHGEVHGSLPDGGDGHVYDGHVRLLRPQVGDHPRPPPVLETAVAAPAILSGQE